MKIDWRKVITILIVLNVIGWSLFLNKVNLLTDFLMKVIDLVAITLGIIKEWFFKDITDKKRHVSNIFVDKDLMFKKDTVIEFCSNDSLILCVNEPSLKPHEDYSKTVNKLLEQEYYSEVWEHRIKRDGCIEAHNGLAKIFLMDMLGDIQKEFQKNSFDDWNSIKLFDICEAVKSYYSQKMFDFNKVDMKQDRIQIFRNIILDYISNFPYNKSNELPYRTLNKSPFNKLFEYKTEAENHNTNYINGINGLIKSVRLSEIVFKGEYPLMEKK